MKIVIEEDYSDEIELADGLRKIAGLVEEGYTSGAYPHWELKQSEDDDEED